MIQTRLINDGNALPLVVEPTAEGSKPKTSSPSDWATEHKEWIDTNLLKHGGILFRGFPLSTEFDFEQFVNAVMTKLGKYVGGNSPRERVLEGVYTSTSYPSEYEIPLHNEMSYANQWPERVCFFCRTPPQKGGETHIGDSRRILDLLNPELKDHFKQKRVKYVQILHGGWGLGKSWQEVFETDERPVVVEFCKRAGIDYLWREDGGLATSQVRNASIVHPVTQEEVWFNQVDQWHPSHHISEKRRAMTKFMAEDELPHNAFFGDGSRIEDEEMDSVRAAYRQAEILFPWKQGDVLLLDNILVAHGRKPFEGSREILVAMS